MSGKTLPSAWLGKLAGTGREAGERAATDRKERLAAQTILRPGEIQGEYDASRLLMTTIGGQLRPLTHDDLAAFRQNVRTAQRRLKGGITARQVLDLSYVDDRDRARSQIRHAVAAYASNGRVRFVTSAGPGSKVSRHHVTVELLGFAAAVAAGAKTPRQAANALRKQPLKFDCDCERHRYWYRYISTIGGFNAGRAETGFPKIRNPNLVGVACKHVLRTMSEVESSGAVLQFLSKLIEKGRANDDGKATVRQTQQDAERQAASRRVRDIKTTSDRARDAASARQRRGIHAAASGAKRPSRTGLATRKATRPAAGFNAAQIALFKQMGLTEAQIAQVAAAGRQ